MINRKTMKSIQIERYGGPEVLIHRELAVPAPGPGDVLVRLEWSGINFMDVHTRQGKYAKSQTYPVRLPTTLGMEGAGTIESIGADVGDFTPGDRVGGPPALEQLRRIRRSARVARRQSA